MPIPRHDKREGSPQRQRGQRDDPNDCALCAPRCFHLVVLAVSVVNSPSLIVMPQAWRNGNSEGTPIVVAQRHAPPADEAGGVESNYAWLRLVASLVICTTGSVALWSVVVALPTVQAAFGVARGDASLPYSISMIGAVLGGVVMGRLADRFGIMLPVVLGGVALGLGYVAAGLSQSLWQFALAHGLLIGFFGGAAVFAPIMADISHWFTRNRGIAVAVSASGSYLAGTVWPPLVQHLIEAVGWRQTHMVIGVICVVVILPLSLVLRRRPRVLDAAERHAAASPATTQLRGFSPNSLQLLLKIGRASCRER